MFAGQGTGIRDRWAARQHTRTGNDDERVGLPNQGIALLIILHGVDGALEESRPAFLQGERQELPQDQDNFLGAAESEGRDEHLAAVSGHPSHGFHQLAFLHGAVGMQAAAVGAFDDQHVGAEGWRPDSLHGALWRD